MSSQPASLGAALRAVREQAGLSLAQVSDRTRIRAGLITLMESDDFEACGGAVYARGHIRSIAHACGADPEPLVELHDRTFGTAEAGMVLPLDLITPGPEALRELRQRRGAGWQVPMAVALAGVSVVAAIAFVSPSGHRPPTVASGTQPSASATPQASAPGTTATSATTPPVLAFSGVQLRVRVHGQPSWFNVKDGSGAVLFQGVLSPGTIRDFHSASRLVLVIGNAGAVDFVFNGHVVPSPGASGEVKTVAFSPDGTVQG